MCVAPCLLLRSFSFSSHPVPSSHRPSPNASNSATAVLVDVVVHDKARDPDGRISHPGQLPLASFPPGDYVLRVTISQSAQKEAREAAFRVVD